MSELDKIKKDFEALKQRCKATNVKIEDLQRDCEEITTNEELQKLKSIQDQFIKDIMSQDTQNILQDLIDSSPADMSEMIKSIFVCGYTQRINEADDISEYIVPMLRTETEKRSIMEPEDQIKYKLYVNGKFKGHVYGTRTTIHIPTGMTEECGRAEIFVEIAEWDDDDNQEGE